MSSLAREAHKKRVKAWVSDNHGVLTRVAKELNLSLPFIWRIAYGTTDAQSKGLRAEHRLASLGCPGIFSKPR